MFEFESQREPLRRCPFCGAPAKYVATASTERGAIRGWVFCIKCQECGASIPKNINLSFKSIPTVGFWWASTSAMRQKGLERASG